MFTPAESGVKYYGAMSQNPYSQQISVVFFLSKCVIPSMQLNFLLFSSLLPNHYVFRSLWMIFSVIVFCTVWFIVLDVNVQIVCR
jgi:hypothetical protein